MIIATNRASEFLDEALTSVERQTYPNWEVVVVDDGSPVPEELARIVAPHPGARIVRQENAGVSIARNVGIAASTGEFCAFLDDDDAWTPDRLELQVAAMLADPAASLAYGRVSSIDATGREIAPASQTGAKDLHGVFDGSSTPQFQTILVRRRNLIRVGGFSSALVHSEDLDLILRLARDGSVVFVDAELAHYRQHGSNNSSAFRYLTASIDAVLRFHLPQAHERRDGTEHDLRIRSRANRRYAFWSASRAARRSGLRPAIGHLAWAVRFAPFAPFDAVARRLSGRRKG